MKLGIMQPYFLPYIGYFQLIAAVDVFIVYDNIKYTKKGWINRNRLLLYGTDSLFSVPLKKDSDTLHVVQRELSSDFNRHKLLSQVKRAYSKSPHFSETFQVLERIVLFDNPNLFQYVHHSIVEICRYLEIETEIKVSSTIPINHDLKSQDKVIALCESMKADTYINTLGGIDLYNKDVFLANGIELQFIKPNSLEYVQFGLPFVPWLSIIDVLMFNSPNEVRECIHFNFELI